MSWQGNGFACYTWPRRSTCNTSVTQPTRGFRVHVAISLQRLRRFEFYRFDFGLGNYSTSFQL